MSQSAYNYELSIKFQEENDVLWKTAETVDRLFSEHHREIFDAMDNSGYWVKDYITKYWDKVNGRLVKNNDR